MRVERKTDTGNSVIRLFFVVLAIAAQVYFLYILIVESVKRLQYMHLNQ